MPTIMLLVGAVLCVAFYLYVFFTAEKPRKGTLEWVEMYEKPKMTRQGLMQKLDWMDLVWCGLMILLFYGIGIGLGACVDVSMLRASLSSGSFLLNLLPTVTSGLLAYLLGRLLSGKVWVGLFPAFFLTLAAIPGDRVMESLLLLGCLVLLLAHFGGKGFGAWLSLVLSAVLLALAAWFSPVLIFLAVPWLGTVLFGEILRMKREDASLWHLILALLAAVLSLGIAITVLNFPLFAADLLQAIKIPGNYVIFWRRLFLSLPTGLFSFANAAALVLTLPVTCLLTAGVVIAIGGMRRRVFAVILLLWTASALIMTILFPGISLPSVAAVVLTFLVSRIRSRGYTGAAVVTGFVPVVISASVMILMLYGGTIL